MNSAPVFLMRYEKQRKRAADIYPVWGIRLLFFSADGAEEGARGPQPPEIVKKQLNMYEYPSIMREK